MSATATKRKVSRVSLWFGLFGGAIAWTIHLMSAYAVAEFGCVGSLGERSYWYISHVAWLELALTAAGLLVAAAATVVAYRNQRPLISSTHDALPAREAERQTARVGLITSGIFTFIILFQSIPILFYLRSC